MRTSCRQGILSFIERSTVFHLHITRCHQINVDFIFEHIHTACINAFFLVGKTMFCMHLIDEWLHGDKLPANIRHIFYFALRSLTYFSRLSVDDLFFEHHGDDEKEYDRLMSTCPDDCVVIFDGADEVILGRPPGSGRSGQREEIPMELVSSIIQGKVLPRVRVIVTSRPGGLPDFCIFDKHAEIYGLTQDRISEFVNKFSGDNEDLRNRIENYIDTNANIASLCYVPVQCGLVCRIVRDTRKHRREEELPHTITQLYTVSVKNLAIEHHPLFKDGATVEDAEVIPQLREPLLRHAMLARCGMGKSPVQVIFSQKEIEDLQLMETATECGLLTVTKEKSKGLLRTHRCTYCFNHLTIQEFFAALALVSSPQEAESVIKNAAGGQLDLVCMFLCGLVEDPRSKEFLDSLGCQAEITAESVLQLVVEREKKKEESDRKQITLLLLLMIYESRNSKLWSTVAGYVMEDDKTLDLSEQHISPVELQSVTFSFQNDDITSLK